jgi:hypothetical protein
MMATTLQGAYAIYIGSSHHRECEGPHTSCELFIRMNMRHSLDARPRRKVKW